MQLGVPTWITPLLLAEVIQCVVVVGGFLLISRLSAWQIGLRWDAIPSGLVGGLLVWALAQCIALGPTGAVLAARSATPLLLTARDAPGLLLAYAALAAAFDISLVFAAFLAGYAIVKTENTSIATSIASISDFAFAAFIPIYFAVVGYRLDLSKSFSFTMLVVFLVASSLMKLFSAGLGARLAGFRTSDAVNLAITLNARGGPGIVLASVALDAGIINAQFYTAMVLVAILTSQAAGVWLAYLLRKGRPLLEGQAAQEAVELAHLPASQTAA